MAAVITEAVANAWDADAHTVEISMDLENDILSIRDDGIGMNREDINERYLKVGYRKRRDQTETELGRKVMGRKGIGKLSLFSIAGRIRVESRKDGAETEALEISIRDMREAIENERQTTYHPVEVPPLHEGAIAPHGTFIELRNLRNERLRDYQPESMRRRIARRFSVIGSADFTVSVNGVNITPRDRENLKLCQYIWAFGEDETLQTVAPNAKLFSLESRPEGWPEGRWVRGWIGTVDRPRQLSTPEGNLNSIVVLSRGRLVDEDILPRVSEAEMYTKYVTGQIEADFLDSDGDGDIITTDRQSLREDDSRVTDLLSHVRSQMRTIANRWSKERTEHKTDELRDQYPAIDDWLDGLREGWRSKAERLLGRIATMELDEEMGPDARDDLVRHTIYGFERLRLRGDAEELADALESGPEALITLLADRDALEAAHYREIVQTRLQAVEAFQRLVDDNQLEKVLQQYLFDHLWLLDPSWDRAAGDEAMEERLKLKDSLRNDDHHKGRFGRVDIRYRTVAGQHMLVELKRFSNIPSAGELIDQVKKYKSAFEDVEPGAKVHTVIVLGRAPDDIKETVENAFTGACRVVTYEELTLRAKQSYGEYLDRTRNIDRLERITARQVRGNQAASSAS